MKKNNINYVLIFIIFVITNISVLYAYHIFYKQESNNSIIAENINNLNKKINNLIEINKLNNSAIKTQDRLDETLIEEFGNDSEFLEKIAKLKKQIIKRELESKVIKLENEKIARNKSIADGNYAIGYKKNISDIFTIMMINATTQKAVLEVGDNIASVGIGDNIRGFKILTIEENQIIMQNPNGEKEVLGINYFNNKTKQNGDKDVK